MIYMEVRQIKDSEVANQNYTWYPEEELLNTYDTKPIQTIRGELSTMISAINTSTIDGKKKGKRDKKPQESSHNQKLLLDSSNHRYGHWTSQENKRYHWFLETYSSHFLCREMRRLDKIFKTMALFIGSREAQQCRSHHQKMEKKYHTFPNILLYLRKFHYDSEDPKMVEKDMANHQINDAKRLITPKQLQDLQTQKYVPLTPLLPEETKIQFGQDEVHKQFQFQQNLLDFLGEDYQHKLQFDTIFL